MSKDGLRFDWYPILQADFLDDLASEIMMIIEAASTSTRGFSQAAAEGRTQQQPTIAKHLLSALYCAYSTVSSKKAPTRVSVIKKTNGFSTNKTNTDCFLLGNIEPRVQLLLEVSIDPYNRFFSKTLLDLDYAG